jgi:putative AlgH/UPF0301 family transcriptional regulator
MAGHYQTGARPSAGSILIAHPRWNPSHSVVLITESSSLMITGIQLNKPSHMSMQQLAQQHDIDWCEESTVFIGGDVSPGALIMLHSADWFSSNTLPVNSQYSISSDLFMLEKINMGNSPSYWRAHLGCSAWDTDDLVQNLTLNHSQWLLLPTAEPELVFADPCKQYNLALAAHSLYLTELHFG